MPIGNDQRDAVSNPSFGDLLAQPHQEQGAGGEHQHRLDTVPPNGMSSNTSWPERRLVKILAGFSQPNAITESLAQAQQSQSNNVHIESAWSGHPLRGPVYSRSGMTAVSNWIMMVALI